MDSTTFLSVITVHYQDFSRLRFTMESLLPRLRRGEIEWVVIDGESEMASESERQFMAQVKQIAHAYVSERDEGIYDAMNKGVDLATGEYVLFLNAGDKLVPEFSITAVKNASQDSKPDMIWCKVRFEYPDGSFGVRKLRGPKWLFYGMPICHQGILFLTRRFSGMAYNTTYSIAADYDLLAGAVKSGAEVLLIQDVVSEYAQGGISQQNRKAGLREESRIRAARFGLPFILSRVLSGFKSMLWKISDFSPAFNRLWRRWI
jgi:putative colanic acid biosynthesis glycosyltransferase